MIANDSAALERAVTEDWTDLEKRDVRALVEYMTVLPLGGSIYSVTTESGSEYRVDALEGRCTCPDYQYNLPTDDGRERCKHISRTAYATGETPIPAWADADAIDEHLGEHTDATVNRDTATTLSSSNSNADATDETIQTDGGVSTGKVGETAHSEESTDDDPRYTYHVEPAHVGGARYVRCETCGAECIPAKPDRMLHRKGCSEGDR